MSKKPVKKYEPDVWRSDCCEAGFTTRFYGDNFETRCNKCGKPCLAHILKEDKTEQEMV